MSRLKEDLWKWLEHPPDTKDRQYELRSLHHKATGRWLLRDGRFVRWKDMPGSLWIKGICKSVSLCSNPMSDWAQLVRERAY
jgi:hypothetical protein